MEVKGSMDPRENLSFSDISTVSTISPEDLHRQATLARAFENSWRLREAYIFLALKESRLHNQLGSSSIEQYAEKHFRLAPRITQEMLRVAEALKGLPRLREAYLTGCLDWACVVELVRVARADTEEEWVAFAGRKTVRVIRLEVEKAVEEGRKAPRKNGHALPDATVYLNFKLRRSEYEIVSQGMQKVSGEIASRLNGSRPRQEDVLVFMSRRFLETDPVQGPGPGTGPSAGPNPGAREEKDDSIFTILYHLCPPCREKRAKALLITRDGPVEVPVEAVERVEAGAHKVTISPEEEDLPPAGDRNGPGEENGPGERNGGPRTIDPPSSPALLRKLKLRDRGVCQNPFCRRAVPLQGAHIERRSEGGPTKLSNLVELCVFCHALEDQGLLEIRGNPVTGLEFITPADRLNAGLREEVRALAAVPFVTVSVTKPVHGGAGQAAGEHEESQWGTDRGLEDLAGGLARLGYGKRASRDALRQAREELLEKDTALTPESLLRAAILNLHPRHSARHPSNGDGPGSATAPG